MFLVILMIFVVFLLTTGCGGNPAAPPIEDDFITIVSVTPDSGLVDGVDTDFTVVVEYSLVSSTEGKLSISFNNLLNNKGNPDNHWYIESANYHINKGYGTHEFNVTIKPKNWGSKGDFLVIVLLDEIPQVSNRFLATDVKILTFK